MLSCLCVITTLVDVTKQPTCMKCITHNSVFGSHKYLNECVIQWSQREDGSSKVKCQAVQKQLVTAGVDTELYSRVLFPLRWPLCEDVRHISFLLESHPLVFPPPSSTVSALADVDEQLACADVSICVADSEGRV